MAHWYHRQWGSGASVSEKRQWGSWVPRPDEWLYHKGVGGGNSFGAVQNKPVSAANGCFSPEYYRKRDSDERRVIMDLSFPPGESVNDKIPKDSYLGETTSLRYPSVDALTQLVREKGQGCALMECNLERAYKQINVDPRDWIFLVWSGRGTCTLIWQCQWVWGRQQCAARGSPMPSGMSWGHMTSTWWHT